MLQISLIGGLGVTNDGHELSLPKSKKTRALLGYLALHPDGSSRDELCQLLFAETNDPKASLRWALSRLRASLDGSMLVSKRSNHIGLDWSLVTTDVAQLEQCLLLAKEDGAQWTHGADFVGRIRGQLLAELAIDESPDFENWRLAMDGRVRQTHMALLQALLQVCDDAEQRVDLAQQLVNVEPMNEHSWVLLVGALSEAGQLPQAQRTRDLAIKQFGVEGTPLNGELQQSLRSSDAASLATSLQGTAQKHRATLAVLPCLGVSEPLTPANVKDRVTEALFAAATANRACAVLAWSMTNGVRDDVSDGQALGERLGADLVLEARLRLTTSGFQLNMELIGVTTGTCLYHWTQEFERCSPDVLAERVTAFFSARFEIDLQVALIAQALAKPEDRRGMWDQYFAALPRIYTPGGHDPVESLALLQQVLNEEPSMGPAAGAAAWVRTTHPQFNQQPKDIAMTAALARRAIELCQDDTFVMSLSAVVIASTERDLATAHDLVRRAQLFNPHSTMSHLALGIIEHYMGNHEAALATLEAPSKTLDTEPLTFALSAFASLCCFFLDRSEEGLQLARKSCGRNPGFVAGRRALTLCLSACGHREEAQQEALRLQALDASEHIHFYQNRSPYQRATDIRRLCDELRLVGVEERN